jgi:hypothetical protein
MGKKMPKQRERKMMPPPQLCTRGQEEIIDHGVSHKLQNFIIIIPWQFQDKFYYLKKC